MPNTILGKVSITPKGNYNSGTAYDRLDAVYDEATNASYLSLKDNNTDALTIGPSWMYLCRGIGTTTDNNFTDAYKAMVDTAVPNTRAIAGSALSADITLSQLINAGLASGTGGKADTAAIADNALSLGGHEAMEYPIITSGTWAPTISGSTVEGNPEITRSQSVFYRIGQYVALFCDSLTLISLGGAEGNFRIGGLPFVAAITSSAGIIGYSSISATVAPYLHFHMNPSETPGKFEIMKSNENRLTTGDTTAFVITFAFCYLTYK